MIDLNTIPGYAIVAISKESKERQFYKEIKLANGKSMKLTLTIPESGLYDGHFSQGVSIAKVAAVGDGVDYLSVGDDVIVDYTIDVDTAKIISEENGIKYVRANALNEYYESDKLISESKFQRTAVYEYRKGDLKSASTIFGVIKDDEIIPNFPYVFLKYVDLEGEFEITESGVVVPSSEGEIVVRQVLFSHPLSPIKAGQIVMVDFGSLYERDVNGELVSICMHNDIISCHQ